MSVSISDGSHRLRRLTLLLAATILVTVAWFAYAFWKKGIAYQAAYQSPNKQYYVQKYSNTSLSNFIAMPGHGSDGIDGYIRLYNKDGVLIHERFTYFIRDIEPVWDGDKVYLKGVAEMDDHPWILPSGAE